MNHLQQALGALELGPIAQQVDAALERSAGPGLPTNILHNPACHHIEDGALELAGTPQASPATPYPVRCHQIDDAGLEASALQAAQPYTSPMSGCHRIEDAALERTHERHAGPPATRDIFCRHIDDGVLEGAAGSLGPSTTHNPIILGCHQIDEALEAISDQAQPATRDFLCRHHIDEARLEATALHLGPPQTRKLQGYPGCI